MANSPEQLNTTQENSAEIQKSAAEQLESLYSKAENFAELSIEKDRARTEKMRKRALETATNAEVASKKSEKLVTHQATSRRNGSINKKQRDESYKKTMKQVRSELPVMSRAFSKIIHNKAVEQSSDFIASTVARPNAILYGSIMAFVFTLVTYVVAKKIGYVLSGFETIAAFALGLIVGIIIDYFKALFTGKKF